MTFPNPLTTEQKYLVANTHLLYNPKRTYVKLGQTILILKSLQALEHKFQPEHVFLCGDFNLVPNSAIYHYLNDNIIDLKADISKFSNQLVGKLNTGQFTPEDIKFMNQKYHLLKGTYTQGGYEELEAAFSLDQNQNRKPGRTARSIRNFYIFEQLATLFPLLDHFDDEIVYVQSEQFTHQLLEEVFQQKYPELQYSQFRQKIAKYNNQARRRDLIASVLNKLSEDVGIQSSYRFVGTQHALNQGLSSAMVSASEFDVAVSQFSNDIKGSNIWIYRSHFLEFLYVYIFLASYSNHFLSVY